MGVERERPSVNAAEVGMDDDALEAWASTRSFSTW